MKDGIEKEFETPAPLWDRLARRIGADAAKVGTPSGTTSSWSEPPWEQAAPGVEYKVLSEDQSRERVNLLVRLAPGAAYPPHRHAGLEELFLLQGELWIDDRKLTAGDYSRAEPDSVDTRVWSETGCVCVLITSPRDVLR